jgi:hypothetical protein
VPPDVSVVNRTKFQFICIIRQIISRIKITKSKGFSIIEVALFIPINNKGSASRAFIAKIRMPYGSLDLGNNIREDIANGWSNQSKDDNDDYSYQNKNKRIFDQALTFFFRSEQHDITSFLPQQL